jgi:hypothetical protein
MTPSNAQFDPAEKLADSLRTIAEGDETVFELVKNMDGEGENAEPIRKLIVERRKAQPICPPRAESEARNHTFHAPDAFIAYLRTYGGEGTVILADLSAQQIVAILDETATKGRERVALEPLVHPRFEPWARAIIDETIGLVAFATFVMAHRRDVVEPNALDLAYTLRQIRISKNTRIEAGIGAHAINGVMVETAVQGSAKNDLVELPETIVLDVPIYVDTDEKRLQIDLTVGEMTDQPVATCTCADLMEARLDIFQGFIEQIQAALGETMTIGLGAAGYTQWSYLN